MNDQIQNILSMILVVTSKYQDSNYINKMNNKYFDIPMNEWMNECISNIINNQYDQ